MRSSLRFILGTDPRAQDTHSPAAIIRFAGIVAVTYSVLIWLQPSVLPTYRAWYRSFGNACFAQSTASVQFFDLRSPHLRRDVEVAVGGKLPPQFDQLKPGREKDTLLMLLNRRVRDSPGFLRSGSRLMGYTPTILLLAMVVATPITTLRRFALLVVGMFLLHGFIAVRIYIYTMHEAFANPEKSYRLYTPGSFWSDILRRLDNVLVDNPTFNYVIPIIIWLIVIIGISLWSAWRLSRNARVSPA